MWRAYLFGILNYLFILHPGVKGYFSCFTGLNVHRTGTGGEAGERVIKVRLKAMYNNSPHAHFTQK